MEETSRSRVTITLGRSGPVVMRAGPMLESGFSGSQPELGSKRSVRDRLGGDADGIQINNKRQRGDRNKLSMNGDNSVYDLRLGKDDLRLKLMQKNVTRRVESDTQRRGVDLRETLSRTVRHSTTSLSMRQLMPESTDGRQRIPETENTRHLVPERSQIPSTRSADALPHNSLRNSYPPWTMDQLRQRSPDRVVRTSRNLLPQRNDEDIMKRPSIRTYDVARTVPYMSRDILEPGRPLGNAPYVIKPTVAAASVKPVVPPLASRPPLSGIVQKSSYAGDEHPTVDGLLHSLGLDRYAIYFKAEEVDMTVLRQMGDNDLKELGIPMGPRKKIMLALLPHSKRPL